MRGQKKRDRGKERTLGIYFQCVSGRAKKKDSHPSIAAVEGRRGVKEASRRKGRTSIKRALYSSS